MVVSLVRSNPDGTIGFLREPERINVMLSRARQGLIIIGDSQTLRNASVPAARDHWGIVLRKLAAAGFMYEGLPAVCRTHGTRVPAGALSSAAAFRELVPDGGCRLPCREPLPCGHLCQRSCHSYDREHRIVRCTEQLSAYCSSGHLVEHDCWDKIPVCATCEHIAKVQREESAKLRSLQEEAVAARSAAEVDKARLKVQQEGLLQRLRNLEEQRAAVMEAQKAELDHRKLQAQVQIQVRSISRF